MYEEQTDKLTSFTVDDIELIPQLSEVRSRNDIEVHPFIYSAPMDTVTGYELTKALIHLDQYPVVSRFLPQEEYERCIRDFGDHPNVFIAIGMGWAKTMKLFKAYHGNKKTKMNVALDIAHGDNVYALKQISYLRDVPEIGSIMSGSIATQAAALRNIEAGATHLRIGIAGGSACTTSLMTGCGVRNAYAVSSIHEYLLTHVLRRNYTLIADGGIRYPGDAMKLMVLGADAVMLGRVFSHAKESAGWHKNKIGRLVKSYRGQASSEFQNDVLGFTRPCAEGVALPEQIWKGITAEGIVNEYQAGIQSGLSYLGKKTLRNIQYANIEYMFLTNSGQREVQPHGIYS